MFVTAATLLPACKDNNVHTKERTLQMSDSLTELKIDSAYKAITDRCDTLMVKLVPLMVDTLLKNDSCRLNIFFDTQAIHTGDAKADKVIAQLRADCDSSLLKETYKRRLLLPAAKPKLSAKKKN